jgi:hypothetical protein
MKRSASLKLLNRSLDRFARMLDDCAARSEISIRKETSEKLEKRSGTFLKYSLQIYKKRPELRPAFLKKQKAG